MYPEAVTKNLRNLQARQKALRNRDALHVSGSDIWLKALRARIGGGTLPVVSMYSSKAEKPQGIGHDRQKSDHDVDQRPVRTCQPLCSPMVLLYVVQRWHADPSFLLKHLQYLLSDLAICKGT